MKVWAGLRHTVIQRKWQLVEIDYAQIRRLRSITEYLEWFDKCESKGRYAVYSVPEGNEYYFEDPLAATEFVLKWA